MLTNRQDSLVGRVQGSTSLNFFGGYRVIVYPVGAIVSQASQGETVQTYVSCSIVPGDRVVIWRPSTFTLIQYTGQVFSVGDGNGIIDFGTGAMVPVQMFDRLVNVGVDNPGSSTPQFDASRVGIWTDTNKVIRIPRSEVVTNSTDGRFQYYHELDGMVWEIALDNTGLLVGVTEGFGGHAERLNLADFGLTGDAAKAVAGVTNSLGTGQSPYTPGV